MLLFMDGQAHYDSTRIGMKYSVVTVEGCTWSVVAEGRFGNCIKRVTVGANNAGHLGISPLMTRLGPWTPTTSGVCGFAVKVDDLQEVGESGAGVMPSGEEFFTLMEGSAAHVGLYLNPTGTLSLWRSRFTSSFDKLAESIEGLQSGAWCFLECKWFIDPTVGTFEIRANGVPIMQFTGNTKGSRNGEEIGIWTGVNLLAARPGSGDVVVLRMCDLYLADRVAADPDDVSDFLGDGIVETILPNGPGSATGWTPNVGANWDATNDDPAPDDDATYVTTTAPGITDLYHFEDLPPGTLVKGAHACILARKDSDGGAAIAPVVHQGGTDYVGPTQGISSITYDRYLTQPYDLNPATMAKFTDAEVNAGQFGVIKIT